MNVHLPHATTRSPSHTKQVVSLPTVQDNSENNGRTGNLIAMRVAGYWHRPQQSQTLETRRSKIVGRSGNPPTTKPTHSEEEDDFPFRVFRG